MQQHRFDSARATGYHHYTITMANLRMLTRLSPVRACGYASSKSKLDGLSLGLCASGKHSAASASTWGNDVNDAGHNHHDQYQAQERARSVTSFYNQSAIDVAAAQVSVLSEMNMMAIKTQMRSPQSDGQNYDNFHVLRRTFFLAI